MSFWSRIPWRQLLIVPPVALGIWGFSRMQARDATPVKAEDGEPARVLEVIEVAGHELVPRASGFGTAKAAREWLAVSEVSGRVVEIKEGLKQGARVQGNDILVRIDSTKYDLEVTRLNAELQRVDAQLAELDARKANYDASLKIEQASLVIAQAALERDRGLKAKKAVAQSKVDESERAVLSQEAAIETIRNSLKLLPAERASLDAQRKVHEAGLKKAEFDVRQCVIAAPFTGDLGQVSVEALQFVPAGAQLLSVYDTSRIEVEGKMPVGRLKSLFMGARGPIAAEQSIEQLREIMGFQASVRLVGWAETSWSATLVRIREQLDARTRTLGFIVSVSDPNEGVIPGIRPPLLPGMFCEVEMRARPQPNTLVIPRDAVHDGHVYIVDAENRLRRRAVQVVANQGSLARIGGGLKAGERLVVSDPVPAIEGMLVEPRVSPSVRHRIESDASGRSSAK